MGEFDPWMGKGRPNTGGKSIQAMEVVQRFVKSRKRHCSEATVDTYRYVLEAFASSLPPGFPLYGVKTEHVSSYVQGRGLADAPPPATTTAFASSFPGVRKRACAKATRPAEADAEMKSLGHGNRWLLDAVRFAAGTGLRCGEVARLRWQAIDLRSRMLRVECTEEFTTKSGRERSVPLVGDAHRVVRSRWEAAKERGGSAEPTGYVFRGATGGKIGPGYLTERFRFYRRLAKLPENLSFHSLRHTFASGFVMRGGDLYRLKEILGHADMKTTLKYAHLRPDALRQEMQKTFGGEHTYSGTSSPVTGDKLGGDGTASDANALRSEVKRLRSKLAEAKSVPSESS